jgi:hypothetical protein
MSEIFANFGDLELGTTGRLEVFQGFLIDGEESNGRSKFR